MSVDLFGTDLFGNIEISEITGDITITGDLQVNGNINSTGEITHVDRVLILNDGELGDGVTGTFSGIEIDRGTETNYQFVFNETTDTFQVGEVGSLQSVVTRAGAITEGKVYFGNATDSLTEDNLFHFDTTLDRLGIGTASPQTRIHLNDSGDVSVIGRFSNSSSTTGLQVGVVAGGASEITSEGNFTLEANSNTLLSGNTAGRVGIHGPINGSYDAYVTGTLGLSSTLNVAGASTLAEFNSSSSNSSSVTRTGAEDANPIISYSNGSGEVARLTKTGRFGIGVTGPAYDLTVSDGSNTLGLDPANNRLIASGADFIIRADGGSENIRVQTDGGERFTVLNGGNIGAGVAAPEVGFQVGGGARVDGNDTASSGAGLELRYNSGGIIRAYDATGASETTLTLDGSSVTFNVSGSPGMALSGVNLTLTDTDNIIRNNATGVTTISGSNSSSSGVARILIYGSSHATNSNDLYLEGDQIFMLDDAGGNFITCTSGGNVGINSASASFTLDVNGIMNCTGVYENGSPFTNTSIWDSNFADDLTTPAATFDDYVGIGDTSPNKRLHIHEATAATAVHFKITNDTTGNTASDGFELEVDASGNALINQKENLDLIFKTNDTNALQISEDQGLHFYGVSEPTAVAGRGVIYYDSTSDTLKFSNNGGSYTDLGSGSGSGGGSIQVAKYHNSIVNQGIVEDNCYVYEEIEVSTDFESIFSMCVIGEGKILCGGGTGTNDADVYLSEDYGKTWRFLAQISTGYEFVNSLCYLGNNKVMAGMANSSGDADLFISEDGGYTWSAAGALGTQDTIASIEYFGNDVIVVGTGNDSGEGDVYRSTNGGTSFTVRFNGTEENIHDILYVGGSVGFFIESSGDAKVYKSNSNGDLWSENYDPGSYNVSRGMVSVDENTIIVGLSVSGASGAAVAKTTDQGDNWTIYTIDSERQIYDLTHCGDGVIVASTTDNSNVPGIYVSYDGGETWESKITNFTGYDRFWWVQYAGNGWVLMGGGEGSGDGNIVRFRLDGYDFAHQSDGNGVAQEKFYPVTDAINRGLYDDMTSFDYETTDLGASLEQVRSIENLGNGVVIIGTGTSTGDANVFISKDYGVSWEFLSNVASGYEAVYSIAHLGGENLVVGMGTGDGDADWYLSSDGGETWTQATTDIGAGHDYVHEIAYCGNDVVVACVGEVSIGNAKIYRSTDGGDTWTQEFNDASERNVRTVTYCENDVLVAATTNVNAKVIMSYDNGETWAQAADSGETFANCSCYADNGVILVGGGSSSPGDAYVHRSEDFGRTWDIVRTGLESQEQVLAITYCGDGIVVASVVNGSAVFSLRISYDKGKTWTTLPAVPDSTKNIINLRYIGNGIVIMARGSVGGDADIERFRVPNPNLFTVGDQGGQKNYQRKYVGNNLMVEITGTSYTLSEFDNGKTLVSTNASATTISIPDGLNYDNFDFQVTVISNGAGGVTLDPTGTANLNGAGTSLTVSQYDEARIRGFVADDFTVSGTYT